MSCDLRWHDKNPKIEAARRRLAGRARARRRGMWEQQRQQHALAAPAQRQLGLRHRQRRRLDVRRPRLPAVGLDAEGPGRHAQLPARRLGRRRRRARPGHRQLRRQRPGADAGRPQDAHEGRGRPDPDVLRRDHGVLQRQRPRQGPQARRPDARRTSSSGRSRPGTTRRSQASTRARSCPSYEDHGRPPLRRVGHDQGLHDVPLRLHRPSGRAKVGADKTVKWPTGTGAKGNDGVAAAIKQTDGAIGYVEQAYALQNNFTLADVKNKSGKFIAPTLESTSAAGEGIEDPAGPRHQHDRLAEPGGVPDRVADVRRHLQGPCKAGMKRVRRQGAERVPDYGLGDGPGRAQAAPYAPLPRPALEVARPPASRLSATASADRRAEPMAAEAHPHRDPAAAPPWSGRCARGCPDPLLRWILTGPGGAGSSC